MAERKAAVIGAGLGGLSAAVYLRNAGFSVDVFEKNSYPGGKAGSVRGNGFRFDAGPSLLTMPFILEELFRNAGRNIQDYLKLRKPEILCEYFYPDGKHITAYNNPDLFAEEVEKKTGEKRENVLRYLDHCRKIYNTAAPLFLFSAFREKDVLLSQKAFKTLTAIFSIDPFRTMDKANRSFFKSPYLVQLFNRYATYNGSSPYRAPATLNIIQHVEYNMGGFIVDGGIEAIPLAIHKLAEEQGVKFYFNTEVERVNTSGDKVEYLQVNGKETEYDCVIVNADVKSAFRYLLHGKTGKDSKTAMKSEPSSSALVFYWGVTGSYKKTGIHNILFSSDYKKEFDELFIEKKCPDDPTVYIYISSHFNRSDAPEGAENWYVMINAPADAGQDWEKERSRVRDIILHKINTMLSVDISRSIVFEKVLTPPDIEKQTSSMYGSLYGISSNDRRAAFLRQRNRSKEIKGLYFCGGSAHPGGGIPLVLLSGKIAAELADKHTRN